MTIMINDLERNEIMSEYSPYVEQKDSYNCVMLELDCEVLDHARKVADALNKKYYENSGKNHTVYTDLFGVLRSMLEIQMENEQNDGEFCEESSINTVYGKELPNAKEGD